MLQAMLTFFTKPENLTNTALNTRADEKAGYAFINTLFVYPNFD